MKTRKTAKVGYQKITLERLISKSSKKKNAMEQNIMDLPKN